MKKKTFTREELCELFRQAEKEYSDQTYGEIPPLDKSFMNAKKSDDKSSKRRRYSLIATAAALMICIVTAVHPMIGNDAAYGDKGFCIGSSVVIWGLEPTSKTEPIRKESARWKSTI